MRERIKENDRDTRFARTQTSAEHANETGHIPIWSKVNFIDRDPYWCTRKVKEDINIRFHPKNINKDSGIEIPEAWIPTIEQRYSRSMRTYEGTPYNDQNDNEDRNVLTLWQPTNVLQIATRKQSTSSLDED